MTLRRHFSRESLCRRRKNDLREPVDSNLRLPRAELLVALGGDRYFRWLDALDDRSQRLAKLGIAVGALAEGAVSSNARKALELGITEQEIEQVALLAISTRGFHAAAAALGWVREVFPARV